MFDYIRGNITELTPAYAVLETGNIGYFIHISLNTYSRLTGTNECKLFTHQVVREDAHLLFGFSEVRERSIFRLLISVSGVGANTARMILSSLTPDEFEHTVNTSDVNKLKSIKGIGVKSAQRIIVDLKDKIGKEAAGEIFADSYNTMREEALSALVMLGFAKNAVEKMLDKMLKENPGLSVEELVKMALKNM